MKYFSMFSGIGGFENGIKKATKDKWKCVGYSEIDKYAIKCYEHHFPEHKNFGDATKINPSELPDFDLLCGGFPCQSFSIAGKRLGFEDTRGILFFDIARIIKAKKPRIVFLENVKGLLSHDKGRTFVTIIATLDELGYNVEWEVLNSKNFGVPQNRERVFIIGHSREGCSRQVFPLGKNDSALIEADSTETLQVAQTMTARDYSNWNGNFIKQVNNPTHSNDRVYVENGISPSLNTAQGGNRQPFVMHVLTPDRAEKRQNGRRFKENGEPSFTLTGQDIHGVVMGTITEAVGNIAGKSKEFLRSVNKIKQSINEIRRLTPTECERLQGFPDGWTDGVSDTQRYKQSGNAVTVNVIEAIMEKMLQCI